VFGWWILWCCDLGIGCHAMKMIYVYLNSSWIGKLRFLLFQ
jgi:hypothetical protein